jgi:NAD+ kinase
MSGYESDKSSALGGSAFLDGDVIDDDDDTGSLTRQLAETAQGVREMSKQLGESSSHVSCLY